MNQQILDDFTVNTVFSSNATHAPEVSVEPIGDKLRKAGGCQEGEEKMPKWE